MKPEISWAVMLFGVGWLLGCAGKSVDDEGSGGTSGGDGTALCAPVCEKRENGGCNEFGSIDNCRTVCGLLLTEPEPCRSAARALVECRSKRANPCNGCNAEVNRANDACVPGG